MKRVVIAALIVVLVAVLAYPFAMQISYSPEYQVIRQKQNFAASYKLSELDLCRACSSSGQCSVGNRCYDGCCRAYTCSDTDADDAFPEGINPEQAGLLSWCQQTAQGNICTLGGPADYCLDNSTLSEVYCNESEAASINISCPSGCMDGACSATPQMETCDDNILNNNESDIDCGGPNCDTCQNGQQCQISSDCDSNYCSWDGICEAFPTQFSSYPLCNPIKYENQQTSEHINIYLVGAHYDHATPFQLSGIGFEKYLGDVHRITEDNFLAIDPYTDFDKINLIRVDDITDSDQWNCERDCVPGTGWNCNIIEAHSGCSDPSNPYWNPSACRHISCNGAEIMQQVRTACPVLENEFALVMVNDDYYGGSDILNSIFSYITRVPSAVELARHELLGHGIGNLGDEYVTSEDYVVSPSAFPNCDSQGFKLDLSSCTPAPSATCGNNVLDHGEECDLEDVPPERGIAPAMFGQVYGNGVGQCGNYFGDPSVTGNLNCVSCQIDTSGCSGDFGLQAFANDELEPGEQCDGTDLGGNVCTDLDSHNGGTLGCKSPCAKEGGWSDLIDLPAFPEIGCYSGCSYAPYGLNRATVTSLMRALNQPFYAANERYICCALHAQTGEYPESCSVFLNNGIPLDQFCQQAGIIAPGQLRIIVEDTGEGFRIVSKKTVYGNSLSDTEFVLGGNSIKVLSESGSALPLSVEYGGIHSPLMEGIREMGPAIVNEKQLVITTQSDADKIRISALSRAATTLDIDDF